MATRRSNKPLTLTQKEISAALPKIEVEKPYGAYVAAGDVWHDKTGEKLGKPIEAKPIDDKATWREVARRVRPEWTDEKFNEAWDSFIEFRRQMCLT